MKSFIKPTAPKLGAVFNFANSIDENVHQAAI
jgi:hypothetical protein